MQTTFWLVLLGFFLAGYLVLEGADFGAGMLLPILGRRAEPHRDHVIRAIAPLFLGNEVWLVVAIGITEGAFPRLDGPLLGTLYPVFVVLLAAWLTRDAGLWFRRHGGPVWRWCWDCAIAVASAALAFGWGVVLGDIALGVPLVGSPQAFGAGPVLCGVLLVGACALHGTVFLNRRLTGPAAQRVRRIGTTLSAPVAAVAVLAAVPLAIRDAPGIAWPLWALVSLVFAAALLARFTSGGATLTATSVTLAAAAPLAALSAGLPVAATASAASTLAVLTPLVIAAAPLLIAAQAMLWWLTRGTTTSRSYF